MDRAPVVEIDRKFLSLVHLRVADNDPDSAAKRIAIAGVVRFECRGLLS
jgi:hypothetical protein